MLLLLGFATSVCSSFQLLTVLAVLIKCARNRLVTLSADRAGAVDGLLPLSITMFAQ